MSTRQRTLNFAVVRETSASALIAGVRRLVDSIQQSAKRVRYAHLPIDVVWWTRLDTNLFYENVRDIAQQRDVTRTLIDTVNSSVTNWEDTGDNHPRAQLFILYARLALLYLVQTNNVGSYSHERRELIGQVCARPHAYIEYEVVPGRGTLLDLLVSAHYLALSNAEPNNHIFVSGLIDIERAPDRALGLASRSKDRALTAIGRQIDTRTQRESFYGKMKPQALQLLLTRARPSDQDALADVLSYMLATAYHMRVAFEQRRFKLAAIFRETLRHRTPAELVDFFTRPENFARVYASWSIKARVRSHVLLDYAIKALAVIRESQRTPIYLHLVEQRSAQFTQAQRPTAFVIPSNEYDTRDMLSIALLRGRVYQIDRRLFYDLPYRIDLEGLLGNGANGAVYATDNVDVVAKITTFLSEREYDVQLRAGEMGYAPRTHSHHNVDALLQLNGTTSLKTLSVIFTERMHSTMQDMLFKETSMEGVMRVVDAGLAAVHRLNSSGVFIHHDLKVDNVMVKADMETWRVIDYGVAWYGGSEYDENALVESPTCTPYGWNPNTSTLEDPREVYPGWMRTVPPGRLESWDRFCLLFNLYVYISEYLQPKVAVQFKERIMEKIKELTVYAAENYSMPSDDSVTVTVEHNFVTYWRAFSFSGVDTSTPWSFKTSVVELPRQLAPGVVHRMYVPKAALIGIKLGGYVGTHPVLDNSYACCMGANCNAVIRFLPSDPSTKRTYELLEMAAKMKLGPSVLYARRQPMKHAMDTDVRRIDDYNTTILVLSHVGYTLEEMLENLIDSALTAEARADIEELLHGAFAFVGQLADAGFIHFSLKMSDVRYNNGFFLIDYANVWTARHSKPLTDFPYNLAQPLFSLSVAHLFTDVYRNFIASRLAAVDSRLAAVLATQMRRDMFPRYVRRYKTEVQPLVVRSDGAIRVRVAYTDASGRQQIASI